MSFPSNYTIILHSGLSVIYEVVSKSFRTGRPELELQMLQLSATRCSYARFVLSSREVQKNEREISISCQLFNPRVPSRKYWTDMDEIWYTYSVVRLALKIAGRIYFRIAKSKVFPSA
jgi:hypothetical protein